VYNKVDDALLNFLVLPNEKNGRAMDICKRKYGRIIIIIIIIPL